MKPPAHERGTPPLVVPHRLPGPPREAILLERENRFLARCALPTGEVIHAHVPDRGRLLELLVPGTQVWVFAAPAGTRSTSWSLLVAKEPASGTLTAIDPAGANARVRALLARGLVPGISAGWSVQGEVKIGESRIDFLLTRAAERLAVEVKSVGVVRGGVALFPDAPTLRGLKHLGELEAYVRRKEGRAMVLFVAQRGDAECVTPDEAIDPDFAAGLRRASRWLDLRAVRFIIRPEGCAFDGEIPVRLR